MKQAVVWALEAGYRHIDCAAIYGNEVEIGEALQDTLGPGKVSNSWITVTQNVSLGVDRTLLSFLFWNVKTLTFYQTISGRVVCASGPETRGRVHHIQAVEHPTSPRGRGAGPPEDSEGPEAGVPGPLPHPLALRLPVSSTSANV